jgi:hypothetical protein
MPILFKNIRYFILTLFLMLPTLIYAVPWYSGPLLSEPAIVTPIGHGYFEMHLFKTYNYGLYDVNYDYQSLPSATTKEVDTAFNYGITQNTEVQLFVTYLNNETENQQAGNLGDTTITLATQLLLQNGRTWPPNIKVMFRQLFPTGRYDQLSGDSYATDATGQGSYLTTLSFNMEHITPLGNQHDFVEFATVSFTHASRVHIKGHSIYGGGFRTDGTLWPGNSIAFNLAGEYTTGQHWGFIMEAYIYAQQASEFDGELGPVAPRFTLGRSNRPRRRLARVLFNRLRPSYLNLGSAKPIGHGNIAEFTLAPAIDYNFTKNISLTGGMWFTVAGKNTPAFYTPMLRFTGNW